MSRAETTMKQIFKTFGLAIVTLSTFFVLHVKAVAPMPLLGAVSLPETLSPQELIKYYSGIYNVSETKAMDIAKKESGYHPNAVGDLNLICKATGKPVRARGIYQITECYHPEITDEQAFDPNFNIEWGIQQMAADNCKKEFSTCR